MNWCYIFILFKEKLLSIWIANAMVTRDVQNKLVITSTPVKEWYQLFQKLPFSLNTLRYLIFGKNIITSYFKAKLVLATPASRIYLLQNLTFVYLLYFFSPQNCKFKLYISSLSLTAVQWNLMVFKYIAYFLTYYKIVLKLFQLYTKYRPLCWYQMAIVSSQLL